MKSASVAMLCGFSAQAAMAADADNGRRLAQQHCSPCHLVETNQRRELADPPPFETITQKYGNAPEAIAFTILAPHPRINVTLSRLRPRTSPPMSLRY